MHVRKQRDDRELRELNRLWVEAYAIMMEVNQKLKKQTLGDVLHFHVQTKPKSQLGISSLCVTGHHHCQKQLKTRGIDGVLSWKHTHT